MNESKFEEEEKIQIVSVREGEQPFTPPRKVPEPEVVVNEQSLMKEKDDKQNYKTIGEYTIDFGKLLGSGKYGKVYPAFHKTEYEQGKRYACKVIELKSSKPTDPNGEPA